MAWWPGTGHSARPVARSTTFAAAQLSGARVTSISLPTTCIPTVASDPVPPSDIGITRLLMKTRLHQRLASKIWLSGLRRHHRTRHRLARHLRPIGFEPTADGPAASAPPASQPSWRLDADTTAVDATGPPARDKPFPVVARQPTTQDTIHTLPTRSRPRSDVEQNGRTRLVSNLGHPRVRVHVHPKQARDI